MTGYTRQSSAEINPLEPIAAQPLTDEFDALQTAFGGISGHTHDGSTGSGPKINLTTSVSGVLPVANGGTGLTSLSTFVTLTGTQTLTNKTLTSPTINGGTITGITDLAVADGGTGASNASGARTNLGLIIGTDVQAYNSNLTTWAGKTAPSGTVVGTSDSQTLTSKTLTSPTITGATITTGSIWTLTSSSLVSGDILYATAANTLTRLPKGSDGQVLTLASGVPAWVAATNSLVPIETKTLAASSEAAFTTGFSTDYDEYIFQFIGVRADTDDATLICDMSLNGGSSYLTSYDYQQTYDNATTSTQIGGDAGVSGIELVRNVDTLAASSIFGKASVLISTTKAGLVGEFNSRDSTGANTRTTKSSGGVPSASRINTVRFRCSPGTITGTIRMYGVKNS